MRNKTEKNSYSVDVLNRQWKAYEKINDSRRRGFYILCTVVAVYILLLLAKPLTPEIPLLGTKVDLYLSLIHI